MWYIKITFFSILESITNILPDGSYGDIIRGWIVKVQLNKCGKKLKIAKNVKLLNMKYISMGNNVYIGYGCWMDGKYGIYIGDNSIFGPYVIIASGNHMFSPITKSFYEESIGGNVSIGKGCWIARRSNNNTISQYWKLLLDWC